MSVCDQIEAFIVALLEEQQGNVELKRNELASRMGCAPSQISYVLAKRFSPLCGYQVESRRGGGGYIRIRRTSVQQSEELACTVREELSSPVSERRAREIVQELVRGDFLSAECASLMLAAVSRTALQGAGEQADSVRSSVLGHMLLQCMR